MYTCVLEGPVAH